MMSDPSPAKGCIAGLGLAIPLWIVAFAIARRLL